VDWQLPRLQGFNHSLANKHSCLTDTKRQERKCSWIYIHTCERIVYQQTIHWESHHFNLCPWHSEIVRFPQFIAALLYCITMEIVKHRLITWLTTSKVSGRCFTGLFTWFHYTACAGNMQWPQPCRPGVCPSIWVTEQAYVSFVYKQILGKHNYCHWKWSMRFSQFNKWGEAEVVRLNWLTYDLWPWRCARSLATQVVNSVSPFCLAPAEMRCLRHIQVLTNVAKPFLFWTSRLISVCSQSM